MSGVFKVCPRAGIKQKNVVRFGFCPNGSLDIHLGLSWQLQKTPCACKTLLVSQRSSSDIFLRAALFPPLRYESVSFVRAQTVKAAPFDVRHEFNFSHFAHYFWNIDTLKTAQTCSGFQFLNSEARPISLVNNLLERRGVWKPLFVDGSLFRTTSASRAPNENTSLE